MALRHWSCVGWLCQAVLEALAETFLLLTTTLCATLMQGWLMKQAQVAKAPRKVARIPAAMPRAERAEQVAQPTLEATAIQPAVATPAQVAAARQVVAA